MPLMRQKKEWSLKMFGKHFVIRYKQLFAKEFRKLALREYFCTCKDVYEKNLKTESN